MEAGESYLFVKQKFDLLILFCQKAIAAKNAVNSEVCDLAVWKSHRSCSDLN